MKNFHTENLAEIWHRAVNLYESGHQNADEFPIENDLSFLQSLGMNKMDVFDFAEDWVCEGEPDLASFLLIHEHRRDYFWEVQNRLNRPGDWIQPAYLPKTRKSKGYDGSRELFPKRKQNSVENFLLKPCFAVEEIEISFTIIGYILQNF
jgi:hypothetical protein